MTTTQSAPTTKIDPAVILPRAVRNAARIATEQHNQVYNPETPSPEGTADEGTIATTTEAVGSEAVTSPSNSGQETTPSSPATEGAAQTSADVDGVVTTPVTPPTSETPPRTDDSWENRYKAMKGRFDRADTNNRALSAEVANLRSVIAALNAAKPTQASSTAEASPLPAKLLTPEEESEYGSDFLEVIGKRAREAVADELNSLRERNAQLEQRISGVDGVVAQTSEQNLLDDLRKEVPNFEELNTNPEFISWLALPDEYSGAIRQELLNQAFTQRNALRVAKFFKGFLAQEAATAPAAPSVPVRTSVPKVSLETLAAPGRAKTAAAPAPTEKPNFTPADVTAFYSDVALGKYKGREDERKRIDKQIFDAVQEGRIR